MSNSCEVLIEADRGPVTSGTVRLKVFSKTERAKKASQAWIICWVCAVAAVFIPLLHFILVPGLLIAGPVVSSFLLQRSEIIEDGTGKCPVCSQEFKIAAGTAQWPYSDVCGHCHVPVKIRLKSVV